MSGDLPFRETASATGPSSSPAPKLRDPTSSGVFIFFDFLCIFSAVVVVVDVVVVDVVVVVVARFGGAACDADVALAVAVVAGVD